MNATATNSPSAISDATSRPERSGGISKIISKLLEFLRRFSKALTPLPYEYESPHKFFGLPLLSINLGPDNPNGKMRHARGVIAIGNSSTGLIAFGTFAARGFFAVAPVAAGLGTVSIASIALISVSVVGVGVVSVSAFAFGYLAVGVLAIGYKSIGIVAIGYEVVGIIGIGKMVRALFRS